MEKMNFINLLRSKRIGKKQPIQLNNLIEILQDGVCITDVNGNIIYLNKSGLSLLSLDETYEVSQINFFEQYIVDDKIIKYLRDQMNQTGLVQNYELQLKTRNDRYLNVILSINLIGDFRQETVGYLFLFKDITELKKTQEQLLQSQKLESIGLMASGIAHDFNNILAAIIPNSELIRLSSKTHTDNYKRAEIIEKSAHRASEIAQRLLTFTRQDENKNIERIDLNKLIDENLELFEHGIPLNVKIKKVYDPNIKYITGDSAQIQQIIMNLLINSIISNME